MTATFHALAIATALVTLAFVVPAAKAGASNLSAQIAADFTR